MIKPIIALALFASASCLVMGQQPASKTKTTAAEEANNESPDPATVPEKALNLSLSANNPKIPLSSISSFPLCDSDGYVLLDMLNPKDLNQHSLVAIAGDKSQTYLPSAISDLHDVFVRGFYSSGSTVAFLVRGTKQTQASRAGSKSPAGYDWSSYRYYLAKFKRDGSFEESVELDTSDDISHVALFSSGGMLALGYDSLNSSLHLLLLDSSGKVSRTLELPAGRRSVDGGGAFRSAEAMMASAKLAGSVTFTPYGENILVWRRDSSDAIVEVQPGGATREVPLQIPKGFTFVQMIPATGWWVANFRREDAKENTPYGPAAYSYFEVRPQDGSLSTKLSLSQNAPPTLACETDGNYMTYDMDKDSNIQIYNSK